MLSVTGLSMLVASSLSAQPGQSAYFTHQTRVTQEQKMEKPRKLDLGQDLEPVYVGGVKPLTPRQVASTPELLFPASPRALPYKKNNKNPHLRGAFNQKGMSCAQAGGIGVHYTYAINLGRKTSANTPANIFDYFYTWTFLNDGGDNGSNFMDGWDIANDNGIPDEGTFAASSNYTKWMTGYDKYLNSSRNRYVETGKIDVSTPQGVDNLKQWIFDMGNGSAIGGLGTFSCNCTRPLYGPAKLATGTEEAGKPCVPAWGANGGHVMTIIGWNDSIRMDINSDGKYTNSVDLNKDGVVSMKDWEIGAWYCMNTWGATWGDGTGCFYMLYRVGACGWGDAYQDSSGDVAAPVKDFDAGGLTTGRYVYTLRDKNLNPQNILTYKIQMNYNKRNNISLLAGIANDINATKPEFVKRFMMFNYQGGALPMQGTGGSADMELCLDMRQMVNNIDVKNVKYFLSVETQNNTAASGTVKSFSLLDYRDGLKEEVCTQTNVAIQNNALTTLSIVYQSAKDPLAITTATLPGATQYTNYSHTLEATGGSAPYTWSLIPHAFHQKDNTNPYPSITVPAPGFPQNSIDISDEIVPVDLGFDFPFYGKTYRTIYISANGFIAFDDLEQWICGKGTLEITKAISPVGADLYFERSNGTDNIFLQKTATSATIRWQPCWIYDYNWDPQECYLDFAATIYSSGRIEFFYDSLNGPRTNMAVGISNGEGANFLTGYTQFAEIPNKCKLAFEPDQAVNGMTMSADGVFNGTPTNNAGSYNMTFAVKDAIGVTKSKLYSFSITGSNGIAEGNSKLLTAPLRIINRTASSIIVSFATGADNRAIASVYSPSGKKIETLFNGMLQQGNHAIHWDLNRKNIPTGVYVLTLAIGQEQITRKINIVR